ncbi:MAG: hypothetical protein LBP28_04140 [Coriobacteriales bacterium]|jgi:glycine cleavage system aminomethyltransferase T|nr:hypothetical protein [Coriobacteriales bacterium]
MYEDFKDLHPIDSRRISMQKRLLKTEHCQPNYYEGASWIPCLYAAPPDKEYANVLVAEEYTGWRDESLATHLTCAIASSLNPLRTLRVSGKDALAFLKYNLVNDFDRFPLNSTKHGVVVNESGTIAATGVAMRTGEEQFELFAFIPILQARYDQQKDRYDDLAVEDISEELFAFQMMGPKSLEVLEEATGEDLHDLRFGRTKHSSIDGRQVRILRFGMHGGLGYEIHGSREDAEEVHRKIVEVGNGYGIRLLGWLAFLLSHTPGASVQFYLHYDLDYSGVPYQYFAMTPEMNQMMVSWSGSAGKTAEGVHMNPFEVGLGNIVNFNHEFIGKEALLAYKANPKRTNVTLKWNKEDIIEVFASQFNTESEPYQQFDLPGQGAVRENVILASKDYVLNDKGEKIGISSGRTFSPFHAEMVSLAAIDLEYAQIGSELFVLWGDEGTRQKRIRATVVPTPFNTHYSNKTFDVSSIPRLSDKQN